MSKSIRDLATEIVADQISVYTNDAGQGSGGPSMIDPGTLAELVESGEIDDYELVEGREAYEIINATLDAHRHSRSDGSSWVLAMRVIDNGVSNPYRHYLLLWE